MSLSADFSQRQCLSKSTYLFRGIIGLEILDLIRLLQLTEDDTDLL